MDRRCNVLAREDEINDCGHAEFEDDFQSSAKQLTRTSDAALFT